MPLFPLPALLGFLINIALLVALFYEDPANSVAGLGFVVIIGIVYKAKQWFRPSEVVPGN